jgi:hypothetical protein
MQTKVTIALPSGDMMHTASALCLASMFARTVCASEDIIVTVHNRKGSVLSQSREEMVDIALETNATHILFVDSDQTYPHDTLLRLLAHKVPVVAANVATKSMPPFPTARAESEIPTGEPVYTFPQVTGLEKIWRIGTGVMLIATHIFQHLQKPWFPVVWDQELAKYHGEDWSFCAAVQRAGFNIYLDHDLSKEVGHLGTTEFTHRMITSAMLHKGQVTEDRLDRSKLSERRLVI